MVQTSEVQGSGSYLWQSDLRPHFGMGPGDRTDKVEVFWPSRLVETFTNLAADRFYIITEGDGTPLPLPANSAIDLAPIQPRAAR